MPPVAITSVLEVASLPLPSDCLPLAKRTFNYQAWLVTLFWGGSKQCRFFKAGDK